MERAPVEVWQQILLNVMETNDSRTSCTPYTFLYFMVQQHWLAKRWSWYRDYLEQRRRLRLVCRAWNEFFVFSNHRWLLLKDRSPMYKLDSTTTTRAKGGVGPVESLSVAIDLEELVIPILSWASHILKRPTHQSPLWAFALKFRSVPVQGYNPFDDLLVETMTTQDLECTNTNMTLRLLSIVASGHISILFLQISRTFTGLRSLFLCNIQVMPQQALRLAHLEVLYLHYRQGIETLQESMEKWDTPALRHVYIDYCAAPLTEVVDHFLGQYTHQIESLILSDLDSISWS
jgi:hypothetical protein